MLNTHANSSAVVIRPSHQERKCPCVVVVRQTHRGGLKRSAATARGSRLSSSAASRGSTRRPVDHSSVRLRFFFFGTFPFSRLFDAPFAPSEEPALALAFPRVVAASSSFPSRNMRMAVSA